MRKNQVCHHMTENRVLLSAAQKGRWMPNPYLVLSDSAEISRRNEPALPKGKAGSYSVTCLLLISGVIDYFKRNRYTLNNRKVGVNLIAFKPDICFISLDVKYSIQLVLPFCRIRQSILRNKNSIYVKLSPNKQADIGSSARVT